MFVHATESPEALYTTVKKKLRADKEEKKPSPSRTLKAVPQKKKGPHKLHHT